LLQGLGRNIDLPINCDLCLSVPISRFKISRFFLIHLFFHIGSPLFDSTVERQKESWGRKKGNRTRLDFNPDHYKFNRSSCQGQQTSLYAIHLVEPSSFNVWIVTLNQLHTLIQ